MFIVYLLLGVLFAWLAIKSFGAAFSFGSVDEHALLAEEESEFEDDFEDDDWEDEEDLDSDEDWRGESESSSSWCPEELMEGTE
ncbi:hypothetical protein [Vibrio nereis]|uniref:hypothetical protein n=1 Tax=Vibrio nereis TaxID=693 RepID=UPI0024940E69|nr:hypothetical protein [Vibrio nereis]